MALQCIECCYSAARVQIETECFNESDVDDVCELMLVGRGAFLMLPSVGRQMFDIFYMFVRSLNPPKASKEASYSGWKKVLLQRLNAIQKDRTSWL